MYLLPVDRLLAGEAIGYLAVVPSLRARRALAVVWSATREMAPLPCIAWNYFKINCCYRSIDDSVFSPRTISSFSGYTNSGRGFSRKND